MHVSLSWLSVCFSSSRRHTMCALVTGVQTCALPISGELKTWWTPADDTAWSLRIAPLVAQYSAYPYPGLREVKVNGNQTQEENAADLAGIELAWDALVASQPELPEESKQAFFDGWARLWPQQMTEDRSEEQTSELPSIMRQS